MKNPVKRRPHEYSFTLLEVIVAVGLLTSVVLQVSGGQGNLFEVIDYSKRSTEATWLARRLMAEVEYNYNQYDLQDLETSEITMRDEVFKVVDPEADYRYTIDIKEWKLPLLDFLTGGGPKADEDQEDKSLQDQQKEEQMAGIPGLDTMVNQIFDGHMLKTAQVTVSWPEGAQRNSVSLIYLLTNQKKLDDYILTKVSTWDKIRAQMDPNAQTAGGNAGGSGSGGNNNNNQNNNSGGSSGSNQGNTGSGSDSGNSGSSDGGN